MITGAMAFIFGYGAMAGLSAIVGMVLSDDQTAKEMDPEPTFAEIYGVTE